MDKNERNIESIADAQHEIWSHWMRYLFSVCTLDDEGNAIIPREKVERWRRQMNTPYKDLIDQEKESDRHQAEKVIDRLTRQEKQSWTDLPIESLG